MVAALRDVFRARGWDGASLSDLSAATGLSRASLYHHFPNGKADMAAAALDDVERRLETELLAPLAGPGEPEDRFAAEIELLRAFYRNGDLGCLLGSLALGRNDHGLGDRIAVAFERWTSALAALAEEKGVAPKRARSNALTVIAALQGALVLTAGAPSHEAFDATLERAPELLFAGAETGDGPRARG